MIEYIISIIAIIMIKLLLFTLGYWLGQIKGSEDLAKALIENIDNNSKDGKQ